LQPIAAMLYNKRVVNAISAGLGYFAHSYTYENHAIVCAVSNQVLNEIRGLLANIDLLVKQLKKMWEEHEREQDGKKQHGKKSNGKK
jgi:adenosylmethionine-8-amino-7-oxononanoate aminotransferase